MTKKHSFIKPNVIGLGYARVAAAVPRVFVGDVRKNVGTAVLFTQEAAAKGVHVITFPELNLTGYTSKDLFSQSQLVKDAQSGLLQFAADTCDLPIVALVGLPLMALAGKLYNVAAVVSRGEILGFVPKTYLPNYGEFEEKRWFSAAEMVDIMVDLPLGQKVLLSPYQTFNVSLSDDLSFNFGITICEDDWRIPPPSYFLAMSGATIIFNLSASNELVTKVNFRRQMVGQRSSDAMSGYVYCSAGSSESTSDLVFGGHCMIYDNGSLLAERRLRDRYKDMIISDIDINSLLRERIREGTWGDAVTRHMDIIQRYRTIASIDLSDAPGNYQLLRKVDPRPFVPSDPAQRAMRCEEIIELQVEGLYQRLLKLEAVTGKRQVVIGISGGLDSTLALLITVRTFELLGWDKQGIIAVTMPGPGTSNRTYKNSVKLIKALGVTFREISIVEPVTAHLRQLGHEPCWKCLQCQNAQARERTQILFDLGFVIGTGDLSEAAQGWCTYNGDHMSSYNVNCDIPKTLVKYLVAWFIDDNIFGEEVSEILRDILDTPISPELVKADKEGEIGQKTEDEIGPYDLHDFFLYHLVRRGETPDKIFYLATLAFQNEFNPQTIIKWQISFYKRFFANQFKRDATPNGPMVGTISLSQRGYWRMSADVSVPSNWLQLMKAIAAELNSN